MSFGAQFLVILRLKGIAFISMCLSYSLEPARAPYFHTSATPVLFNSRHRLGTTRRDSQTTRTAPKLTWKHTRGPIQVSFRLAGPTWISALVFVEGNTARGLYLDPPPTLYSGLSTIRGHISPIKGTRKVLVEFMKALQQVQLRAQGSKSTSSGEVRGREATHRQ